MPQRTKREKIIATVSDLASQFMYYDRKEDEELPRGAIEKEIKAGRITVEEIVAEFEKEIRSGLKE